MRRPGTTPRLRGRPFVPADHPNCIRCGAALDTRRRCGECRERVRKCRLGQMVAEIKGQPYA